MLYRQNPYDYDEETARRVSQAIHKPLQTVVMKDPAASGAYRGADTSGNDYANLSGMSDVHKAALSAASQAWFDADKRGDQAAKDAAHQKAESIRALYDYSGGTDGTEYIPIAKQQTQKRPQSFSYQSAPQYVNQYQDLIDELRGKIMDRDPFSYDPETDPAYQQYRQSYTAGGQQAMRDTLGQVSARTGGLASSYAGSAAQQTYDGYMSALADKIPQLRQLAYEMYQDEGDRQRLNLDMIAALEREDYAKYQDLLSQYNADRSFSYGQYRDDIADARYGREFNYQTWRDLLGDLRYADETAYNREVYQDETAYNRGVYQDETAYNRGVYQDETDYNRALQRAKLLAESGDFSGYKELGYSDEEVQRMQGAYLLQHPELAALNYSTGQNGSPAVTLPLNTAYIKAEPMASTGPSRSYSGSALLTQAYPGGAYAWEGVEDWVAKYGADSAEDYIKEHYKELGYKNYSTALAGWKNHLTETGYTGASGGGGGSYSGSASGSRSSSGGTSGGGSGTGVGEKTITSVYQLGPAAFQLLNHSNPDPNYTKERIIKGIENGTITEAEGRYVMKALGYEFKG